MLGISWEEQSRRAWTWTAHVLTSGGFCWRSGIGYHRTIFSVWSTVCARRCSECIGAGGGPTHYWCTVPIKLMCSLFISFSQNGCRRPFWMAENHFRSHFSPFQINTQLWFFCHKMAAGGHFGWPKATFDHISHKFQINMQLLFFWFCSQNVCRRPFWIT